MPPWAMSFLVMGRSRGHPSEYVLPMRYGFQMVWSQPHGLHADNGTPG